MHLPLGLYRHYKGKEYQVIQIAIHSETNEKFVVYRCLYGDYRWTIRPLTMFIETVTLAGETVPRFEWIKAMEFKMDINGEIQV